jgi:hypothetical protein
LEALRQDQGALSTVEALVLAAPAGAVLRELLVPAVSLLLVVAAQGEEWVAAQQAAATPGRRAPPVLRPAVIVGCTQRIVARLCAATLRQAHPQESVIRAG